MKYYHFKITVDFITKKYQLQSWGNDALSFDSRINQKTVTSFSSAEHSAHSHAERHAAHSPHSHAERHSAESSSHEGVVAGGTGARLPIPGVDAGIRRAALDSGIHAVPVVESAGSSKGVVAAAAAATKGRIERSAAECTAESAAESGVTLAPRVAELLVGRRC